MPSATGEPRPAPGRGRAALDALPVAAGTAISAFALAMALARPWSILVLEPTVFTALVAALSIALVAGVVALVRRPRIGLPARLRLGFCLFVLASAVWFTWYQPFKALWFLMFWGIVAGVHALLLTVGPALVAMLPDRARITFDRAVTLVCATAVALELGLRAIAAFAPSPLFEPGQSTSSVLARYRKAPGERHLGFRCDSRGFYDDEHVRRDGTTLVCAIGDSFSVGVVPHWFHYTTVAERALPGLDVYNAGVIAAGPAEYLALLDEVDPALSPDAVLLCLFLGNDVVESIRIRPGSDLLRAWFDRDRLLVSLVAQRLVTLLGERAARGDGAAVGAVQGSDVETTDSDPQRLVSSFPWLDDALLERAAMTPERFAEVEIRRALAICDVDDLSVYDDFFAAMTLLRERIGDDRLLVLAIPDEFQVEDHVWATVEAAALGRRLDRGQPQRLLAAWLAERGIPTLDLLPALRAVAPLADGRRHLYHLRDTHLNRRGNEVAGLALARFLAPRVR